MAKIKYANRGKAFEDIISSKCEVYKQDQLAYIHKLPTEWNIRRVGGKIVSGFPVGKSKLDYYGTLRNGISVYIEAKTTQDNSFSLSNIKDHQYEYAKEIKFYTDHVYYLIEMRKHNKTFLVYADKVQDFKDTNERKSLSLNWLENNGLEVIEMDFLKHIEN